MPKIIYPQTWRDDVVEEHFGQRIADPYRWLENDARSNPQVAAWIAAQNAVTESHLAALPSRDIFRKRLKALFDQEQFTPPHKRGGRYFFTRNPGLDNQPCLYMRQGATGKDRVLIDPNAWSEDGADALAEWAVCDNGAFVAYGVQKGGTDWRTIKVLRVETGEVLEDEVEWARFTQIAWERGGSGFFYSRFPQPAGGAASMASVANHSVYFHALGTPQSEDRLVYATPGRPELHIADRTDDGCFLVVYSTQGAGSNALTVIDLTTDSWTPRTLIADHEAEWSVIGSEGPKLFVMTSQNAERRKIVTLDLADPHPAPLDIVPEDAAVLTNAALLGGRLLVTYLVDANTQMRRYQPDGTPDGVVQLPGIGSAGGFRGDVDDNEAFFVFTSFDAPITVYRYDVQADTATVWAQPKMLVDPSAIAVEQRFYASKDGTEVPVFIVRRKDLTGPAPTLLYGYGGFGIALAPVYSAAQMAWIEQGGIVAVANIRGGGEYGKAWHRAGQFQNKQNVFDDFIAAAEFLQAKRITPEGGLVIQGGSNGGLLIGAVVNQRPELFAAALPDVGVMDMLRYHLFTGGSLWMAEFGSPAEEAHFHNLLTYSPYHNIQPGKEYPAILATTADTDDRVVPGHSFKYIAAMQAAGAGPKPHLLRVETRAGHGAGMPMEKVIEQIASLWAFAAHWSGLDVKRYSGLIDTETH